MEITVLIDDSAVSEKFYSEHGLSIYITTDSNRVLFDFGQTDHFLDNAHTLSVDLSDIDIAVLSHGHHDHGGGISGFLTINRQAKIYAQRRVFNKYYTMSGQYVGLDPQLLNSERFFFINDLWQINENLLLYTCNERSLQYKAVGNHHIAMISENCFSDKYWHELYLLIIESGRRILFSGCSHKGILNIISWFKPDVFVGGFHFKDVIMDDYGKQLLETSARILLSYNTQYYTCHCTGDAQFLYLQQLMGNRLKRISTGNTLRL